MARIRYRQRIWAVTGDRFKRYRGVETAQTPEPDDSLVPTPTHDSPPVFTDMQRTDVSLVAN